MKKSIFILSLLLTGLMTSCVEKNEEVPADEKPSWLGSSIYQELKNPNPEALTGTFNTYLRLVDDLDYAEILDRTGSKTVFPANDEAFERFFSNNNWGVSSYDQLTESQKKLLLYSSMLDNALLVSMLPNVSSGATEVMHGMAIKHPTAVSVIDSIQFIPNKLSMPAFNPFWEKYHDKGIHVVSDNTRPMMVHLTRDYMLSNTITTKGPQSDFAIITGSEYTDGMAYIFGNKIITKRPDGLTCQNGYVHQMEDVLVPPGNMPQMLKADSETSLFSRVLDYFNAPFFDKTTTDNYNSWALQNNQPLIDSIYQIRYFSGYSQGGSQLAMSPDNVPVPNVLTYDPGWNGYYPQVTNNVDYDETIVDIGAMFVPDDKAFENYFLPGGHGEYLIDIYGAAGKANTKENLAENLDSLHKKAPGILTSFVKNLQKTSFAKNVPSKFPTVTNDASENMGLTVDMLKKTTDGKYDIKIANNGVIYVLNQMIAPDEYQSVMAPVSTYPDMRVMRWAVKDRELLLVDFQYYLLAMNANFAFFIPEDSAFQSKFYVDPATLPRYPGLSVDENGNVVKGGVAQGANHYAQAVKFFYDGKNLNYQRYKYDPETNEIGDLINGVVVEDAGTVASVKSLLVDILNYHTVILDDGEKLGANKYYKTKHGAEICIDGAQVGNKVMTGLNVDNGYEAPVIKEVYQEKNGVAYRIDRIIEAPQNSVYKTLLENNARFSQFIELCDGFGEGNADVLEWAGIAGAAESGKESQQQRYRIFDSKKMKDATSNYACLDQNVRFFNTYNYTLYAPNNGAMDKAFAQGLPRWTDIRAMFEKYAEGADETEEVSPEEQADKDKALAMIMTIRDFIRYHFQTMALYADNKLEGVASGETVKFQTMSSDELGVALELSISGGNGVINITDASGATHVIDANDQSKVSNKMTRDYWFDGTTINTSSFCAIHELSEPLNSNASGSYAKQYSSKAAQAKAVKKFQKEINL